MTELTPNEKFKHLAKVGPSVLQCIACGDCREQTDYTTDPQKWGVCVARDHTSGFEPFFGRGKMQIIRSLWQGKYAAESCSNRRGDRAFDGDAGFPDGFQHRVRQGRAVTFHDISTSVGYFPFKDNTGCLQDPPCGFGNLGADAVAGNKGNIISQFTLVII